MAQKLFNNAQIEFIRKSFGKHEKMLPEHYEKLANLLDKVSIDILRQLYNEGIPFVSSLALNRIIRYNNQK